MGSCARPLEPAPDPPIVQLPASSLPPLNFAIMQTRYGAIQQITRMLDGNVHVSPRGRAGTMTPASTSSPPATVQSNPPIHSAAPRLIRRRPVAPPCPGPRAG